MTADDEKSFEVQWNIRDRPTHSPVFSDITI